MIRNKRVLAVIPARKGSKRLPNKNILDLAGKPLTVWTINAGLNSKYIDKVVVSTDSDKISKVSIKAGAEVPFIRPKKLATDKATTYDVVRHVIDHYKHDFDVVVLLQPTSPLRTNKDVDAALELFVNKKANAVISVCEVEHSPLLCNTIGKNGSMSGFLSNKLKSTRSQDLPKYYRINGAVYVVDIDRFIKEGTFFLSDKVYAYVMSQERSIDIDTKLDFKLAETILNDK